MSQYTCRDTLLVGGTNDKHALREGDLHTLARCPLCYDMFSNKYKPIQLLQNSSKKGCISCALLWKIAECFTPKTLRTPNRDISFIASMESPYTLKLSVRDTASQNFLVVSLFSGNNKGYQLEVPSLFSIVDELITFPIVPQPSLHDRTSSPDVWRIVNEWLHECYQSHTNPSCVLEDEEKQLPTRLLDINPVGYTPGYIKLYETVSAERAKYCCLSHCWGPNGCPLKTTSQNLQRHKDSIPVQNLPKTFRDAVTFTRWLGIKYLWIDALCIIQDDDSDWQRESAMMASIYEYSFLTLSAVKAMSAADGLFTEEDRAAGEYEFNYPHDTSLGPIRIHMRENINHSPLDGDIFGEHEGFPLLSRAWAFQERILSPRTLHFGLRELYWECRKCVHCECGQWRSPRWTKRVYGNMLREQLLNSSPSPMHELVKKLRQWREMIEKYSFQQLTFPTDRLPAISGLAKRVGQTMPDSGYLAGLWDIDNQALLWRTYGAHHRSFSSITIAPSWSWASVNMPIKFPVLGLEEKIFYNIVGAECIPMGDDPNGRLTKGELFVEGQLEPVKYRYSSGSNIFWTFPKSSLIWKEDYTWTWWDAFPSTKEMNKCYLLRLIEGRARPAVVFFLILKSVEGESESTTQMKYRRYGMIEVIDADKGQAKEEILARHSLFRHTEQITIT